MWRIFAFDPQHNAVPYKPNPGGNRFPFNKIILAQVDNVKYPQNLQVFQGNINSGEEKIIEIFEKFIHFQSYTFSNFEQRYQPWELSLQAYKELFLSKILKCI